MSKLEAIREAAEADLLSFIKLIAPHRVLGKIHEDVINWWTREDRKDHQLLLMPRDHGKSAMIAYRVAWELTRCPWKTFLYISSTSTLAQKQLYFIKNILTSKIYKRYWPDMLNDDEGRREKWTESEIIVDHPKRKAEGVRDPSIFTAGLTTSITGLHFDIAVLDDVVVKENAYTNEGRNKVREQYSLLASIESADSEEWVVGTRYHPNDLYADMLAMEEDVYDEQGELVGSQSVYEHLQYEVEDIGDGAGEFLWPRQQRYDGKWFGFNASILAKKRAKYLDKSQFWAQYYNNPNKGSGAGIEGSKFQYYNKKNIDNRKGIWYHRDSRINVFAAIDFAFSLRKKADYTALVVVGVDSAHNYYVLDVDRFKTDSIKEYYSHILSAHNRWGFRKLRAEVSVAQQIIVRDLKENYIKPNGLALSIDEYRPSRHEGTKDERIRATLNPRYDNMQVWHYKGGNCQLLEEELMLEHPPHDDIIDALTAAIDVSIAPSARSGKINERNKVIYHPRFGGIA